MNLPASTISPEDKIPPKQKIAYAAGGAVEWFTGASIGALWMPVFNLGFGMSPALLGIVSAIHRIYDAFSDPIIGNISDNTRTRWGRRRPYIFVGSILTALVAPLLWRMPEGWSQTAMFAYLVLFGILLYTCTTIWAMSYNSLMLEMTPSYDERTRVAGYRTIAMKFGALLGTWILTFASSSWFADPQTGEADLVNGIQHISIWLSVGTIALGVLPAIFVKERYYAADASKQAKEPLLKGILDSLKLKPLWMLTGIVTLQVFGNGLVGALGFYINLFYVNDGKLANAAFIEGLKGSTAFIVGLAAVPFWIWVCERLDKKWTLMIIIGSGFIAAALNLICIRPDLPYLQIVPAVFYASVTASVWLILPSMMADVVDCDELRTHRRREGNINAIFSWFFKAGTTLSTAMSGFVLVWTGFDAAVGSQPREVLDRMFLLYITVPSFFYSIALALLWFYPLTRKKSFELRAELEARRGKV